MLLINFYYLPSLGYSKWDPHLTFNASALINLTPQESTPATAEESVCINVIGAIMIALAVLIPLIVSYPKFRYRPQCGLPNPHNLYR